MTRAEAHSHLFLSSSLFCASSWRFQAGTVDSFLSWHQGDVREVSQREEDRRTDLFQPGALVQRLLFCLLRSLEKDKGDL